MERVYFCLFLWYFCFFYYINIVLWGFSFGSRECLKLGGNIRYVGFWGFWIYFVFGDCFRVFCRSSRQWSSLEQFFLVGRFVVFRSVYRCCCGWRICWNSRWRSLRWSSFEIKVSSYFQSRWSVDRVGRDVDVGQLFFQFRFLVIFCFLIVMDGIQDVFFVFFFWGYRDSVYVFFMVVVEVESSGNWYIFVLFWWLQ